MNKNQIQQAHTYMPSNVPFSIELVVEQQSVDIIRQDADIARRLVYLKFTNYAGTIQKDPVFIYTDSGKEVTRKLATISPNDKVVYDTAWVNAKSDSIIGTIKTASGEVIWEGTLQIQKAPRQHEIKKSKIYSLNEIPAGSIRGVNYYPRYTAWKHWTASGETVWKSEFKEISEKLKANAIRTFVMYKGTDLKPGKTPKPEFIELISKLYGTADSYGIKVLMCLEASKPSQLQAENMRYVRGMLEPFMNDGRVLAWDLINEVDAPEKGLTLEGYVDDFCREFNVRMSEFDPNHPNCIGFAYQPEKAAQAGLDFDGAQQFWQYHWYRKMETCTITNLADKYFNQRPFLLGECGDTSIEGANDAPRPYTGEKWQLDVYKTIIPAVAGAVDKGYDIKGMLCWMAFEAQNVMNVAGVGHGEYGLIRGNGELKPAGAYLSEEYGKLKKFRPSPWG